MDNKDIDRKRAIHQLRVNVKSLAAEARFIRQEVKRTKYPEIKASLTWHRQWRVRQEARVAHLCLAYVKGLPYKACEPVTRTPVTRQEIVKKLARFIGPMESTRINEWLVE